MPSLRTSWVGQVRVAAILRRSDELYSCSEVGQGMPGRKPSIERQRRLGAELRRMREHIGMTINEAATLHRTDRTTVSNTESARSGVSGAA
ncbi:helix-turn-helix domain-containing protein [Streptomyces globisporus]